LLAQVPAGSQVTVLGITDKSFAQPDILLLATIPDDPGYFGERLKSAQLQLVHAWNARSANLAPNFRQTDILGALLLAGEIFNQQNSAGDKTLVILSDMRQQTADLDLESPSTVPRFYSMRKKARSICDARLGRVRVYILGVDGAGKSLSYWRSLQQFWTDYIRVSGASLESYMALREQRWPVVK
jgi:hypothetical protein